VVRTKARLIGGSSIASQCTQQENRHLNNAFSVLVKWNALLGCHKCSASLVEREQTTSTREGEQHAACRARSAIVPPWFCDKVVGFCRRSSQGSPSSSTAPYSIFTPSQLSSLIDSNHRPIVAPHSHLPSPSSLDTPSLLCTAPHQPQLSSATSYQGGAAHHLQSSNFYCTAMVL
jgi:hypothetical protein